MSDTGDSWSLTSSPPLQGEATVPGDKSISHRLAMLSLLCEAPQVIDGFLTSEDCLNTLAACEQLGAGIERDGTRVTIKGNGRHLLTPATAIDMGNSGTGIRLLTGLIAGMPVEATLSGDASLCSRPMRRITEPLTMMGADVELRGAGGCAPIHVKGGGLHGISYPLPMASAQVKSCVLLAGLCAEGQTVVIEPQPTRDHTELLLRAMGYACNTDGLTVTLDPSQRDSRQDVCREWRVPGDFSSAAFWLVAAAMREGSDLTLRHVGLNPRRTALLDILSEMGADVTVVPIDSEWESAGDIRILGGELRGVEVRGDRIPNVIDELPVLAVAAAAAKGITAIRDAAELRVKESDRIATTIQMLRKFGVAVDEHEDGMTIHGGVRFKGGGTIDSGGDHRIAMAGAVMALSADSPVRVRKVACVDTSYPGFKQTLDDLAAVKKTGA